MSLRSVAFIGAVGLSALAVTAIAIDEVRRDDMLAAPTQALLMCAGLAWLAVIIRRQLAPVASQLRRLEIDKLLDEAGVPDEAGEAEVIPLRLVPPTAPARNRRLRRLAWPIAFGLVVVALAATKLTLSLLGHGVVPATATPHAHHSAPTLTVAPSTSVQATGGRRMATPPNRVTTATTPGTTSTSATSTKAVDNDDARPTDTEQPTTTSSQPETSQLETSQPLASQPVSSSPGTPQGSAPDTGTVNTETAAPNSTPCLLRIAGLSQNPICIGSGY